MELRIPNNIKKLWDAWNLRGCIMLSLFLQVFLVLFASSRQRSKSKLLLLIWSAYLLTDWVAAVGVGMITKSQMVLCEPPEENDSDLYAFWASFLLLHLGGPDTITSYALEDNEFWLRHLFGLFLQVVGAAYSLYLTLPTNKLWLPTVLVFAVGTVKYAERTYAFYLASFDRFSDTLLPDPKPGPGYEEIGSSSTESSNTGSVVVSTSTTQEFTFEVKALKDYSDERELVQVAYKLFERFKGLVVGIFMSFECRKASREVFLGADHNRAFRVIEHELSLLYEALHTKGYR